jgi:hypothetical protein
VIMRLGGSPIRVLASLSPFNVGALSDCRCSKVRRMRASFALLQYLLTR